MSERKIIVAIDGPAGSGKSTVTHLLAKKLKYTHVDTGALYRAVALKAIKSKKADLNNGPELAKLIESLDLKFEWDDENRNVVIMDGRNVTDKIRTPEISMAASKISAFPEVRAALLGIQREMGKNGGVVLEGRDIGTVVFPQAEIKFYLTASVESRVRRRMVELEGKGVYQEFDEVKHQVVERDKGDMERAAAPLKKAKDAIELDTTKMDVEEVVEKLFQLVSKRIRHLDGEL